MTAIVCRVQQIHPVRGICASTIWQVWSLFGNVKLNLIISTYKKVPCLIHFWSTLAPLDLDTFCHQISILLTANCVMDVLDFFESTNKAPMASVSAFGFRFQSSVNPPRKRIVILPDPFLLKRMENICIYNIYIFFFQPNHILPSKNWNKKNWWKVCFSLICFCLRTPSQLSGIRWFLGNQPGTSGEARNWCNRNQNEILKIYRNPSRNLTSDNFEILSRLSLWSIHGCKPWRNPHLFPTQLRC